MRATVSTAAVAHDANTHSRRAEHSTTRSHQRPYDAAGWLVNELRKLEYLAVPTNVTVTISIGDSVAARDGPELRFILRTYYIMIYLLRGWRASLAPITEATAS